MRDNNIPEQIPVLRELPPEKFSGKLNGQVVIFYYPADTLTLRIGAFKPPQCSVRCFRADCGMSVIVTLSVRAAALAPNLAAVVQQHGKPERGFRFFHMIIARFRQCSLHRPHGSRGVLVKCAFVVAGILLKAYFAGKLGQYLGKYFGKLQQDALDILSAYKLFKLRQYPFSRYLFEQPAAFRGAQRGNFFYFKAQHRRESQRSHYSQRVLGKPFFRLSYTAYKPPLQVFPSPEKIDKPSAPICHAVYSEVATGKVVLEVSRK